MITHQSSVRPVITVKAPSGCGVSRDNQLKLRPGRDNRSQFPFFRVPENQVSINLRPTGNAAPRVLTVDRKKGWNKPGRRNPDLRGGDPANEFLLIKLSHRLAASNYSAGVKRERLNVVTAKFLSLCYSQRRGY